MNVERVALVGSSGGHLAHLQVLRPWWKHHDRFWVTFDKPDARSVLAGERTYWCHSPTNRNLGNLLRNFVLAYRLLRRERPTLIVSTGAAAALPFFYLGKFAFGARTVFLEVIDRVAAPSLTGRLIRPATDRYVVQVPEQLAHHPRAHLVGPLF